MVGIEIIGGLTAVLLYSFLAKGGMELKEILEDHLPDFKLIDDKRKDDKAYFVFKIPPGKDLELDKIEKRLKRVTGLDVSVEANKFLNVVVYLKELPKKVKMPDITDRGLKVVIGMGRDGLVYHDFEKYPHMIVAGHTGYGKTTFIKSLLNQLDGEICLIDMKGADDYPRVTANEIEKVEAVLGEIAENMKYGRDNHLFVVVDEAAELVPPSYAKKAEKEPWLRCQEYVHKIAQQGRSLKVHLIYATQYPLAHIVPGEVKQNCETRVVFRLPTDMGSKVALDETGAEELPAGLSGRAIYKNDKKLEIQTFNVKGVHGLVKIRDSESSGTGDIVEIG